MKCTKDDMSDVTITGYVLRDNSIHGDVPGSMAWCTWALRCLRRTEHQTPPRSAAYVDIGERMQEKMSLTSAGMGGLETWMQLVQWTCVYEPIGSALPLHGPTCW